MRLTLTPAHAATGALVLGIAFGGALGAARPDAPVGGSVVIVTACSDTEDGTLVDCSTRVPLDYSDGVWRPRSSEPFAPGATLDASQVSVR